PIAHSTFSVEKMPFFKYRLRFSRKGKMRFLSQLEQIELIRRCIRRASLPVAHSYGFHPQMKISFGPAISVGYESDCEYADAVFTGAIDMKSTAVSINNSLPEGFSLIEIKQIPIFFKPVEVETISITYSVENLTDITGNSVEELKRILGDTLSSAQMLIEKKPNVVLDAKPLLNNPYFDGSVFKFELKLSPGRNIKPEKILAKIFDLNDKDVSLLIIKRLSLTS
ncbi:MAG: TIGR03936 family radical SAM-associated protein, partial [Elusimicrobiota bacterium]